MIDFILKYWLECAFGLVVTFLSFACKKFWTMYKNESKRQMKKEFDNVTNSIKNLIESEYKRSQADDEVLQLQIDALVDTTDELKESTVVLKKGLLSMQGKQFIHSCEKLLENNHTITLDEYQKITEDHDAYKALGGNSKGDELFELVKKKMEKSLTPK